MERRGEEIEIITNSLMEEENLEDIMNRFVSIPDVSGAAILRPNGSLISWKSRNNGNNGKMKMYIDFILDYMRRTSVNYNHSQKDSMFKEAIMDFNGSKIMTKKIGQDMVLFLIIKKKAYLGLTMLDVEGCLQNIETGLDTNYIQEYHNRS